MSSITDYGLDKAFGSSGVGELQGSAVHFELRFRNQLANFVIGREGDLSYSGATSIDEDCTSASEISTSAVSLASECDVSIAWQGSMVAKTGVGTVRMPAYGLGGWGFAHVNLASSVTIAGVQTLYSDSGELAQGLVFGAGAECLLTGRSTIGAR
ncbi:MAG: hypothetical protein AAGB04_09835 [Pseudomonadota bacterium]